jgi:hypothetical protein
VVDGLSVISTEGPGLDCHGQRGQRIKLLLEIQKRQENTNKVRQ